MVLTMGRKPFKRKYISLRGRSMRVRYERSSDKFAGDNLLASTSHDVPLADTPTVPVQAGMQTSFDVGNKEFEDSESKLHREADQDHRKAVSLVRKIFNNCWEKATGKHRVPYRAIKEGKFRLEVKNLPSGVKFRDPSCMGLKTLKSIMGVKDLEIIVLSQPSNAPVLGNEGGPTETETAGHEQSENEAMTPSLSEPTETAVPQQSDTEAMIPSFSKDDVDILLGAVGSSEFQNPMKSKVYEVEQILQ